MAEYIIIDEPKPGLQQRFIVDPTAIFLVSILLPLLFTPPLLGQYWMPFVWLMFNGYLLGSPTFKSELMLAIGGFVLWFLLVFGAASLAQADPQSSFWLMAFPYFRILSNGVFFLSLYLIVFRQSGPYAIHKYVSAQANRT